MNARAVRKYALPQFLKGTISEEAYRQWLYRKAQAHLRRDRKRGYANAIGEVYRLAIHEAVNRCEGRDCYTGEQLDWTLLGRYDNEDSRVGRRAYKHSLALLPTVDHAGDGTGAPNFRICSWRVNDAKHDLQLFDFLVLCKKILEHHGYGVTSLNPDVPLVATDFRAPKTPQTPANTAKHNATASKRTARKT